jgi:4-hydroxybenzoate polyprenyltransferase
MTLSSTVINYLRLVRMSNVFTTISNILVGYLFFTNINNFDYFIIFQLISISAFLYIGGMVLNDYFDLKIDKKERPWRPLPSNKITKKNALIIILFSFSYSLIFSFFMGSNTFIITVIMVSLIFLYNKFWKNTIFGPINMGIIRSFNLILGTSQSATLLDQTLFDYRFLIPVFCEFFYVYAITALSKNETQEYFFNFSNIIPFIIIFLVIFFIFIFIFFDIISYQSLIPLGILFSFILYTQLTLVKKIITIQRCISYLIMLIIILDSIFITDIIGIYYSLTLSLLLIIPIIFLSKKIYMS